MPDYLDTLVGAAAYGARSLDHVDLARVLSPDAARAIDRDAPETLAVPSGRRHRLEYNDDGTVTASVKKTGRAIVAYEGWRTGGAGAEIAAQIHEAAFDSLDAPVARVPFRALQTSRESEVREQHRVWLWYTDGVTPATPDARYRRWPKFMPRRHLVG